MRATVLLVGLAARCVRNAAVIPCNEYRLNSARVQCGCRCLRKVGGADLVILRGHCVVLVLTVNLTLPVCILLSRLGGLPVTVVVIV